MATKKRGARKSGRKAGRKSGAKSPRKSAAKSAWRAGRKSAASVRARGKRARRLVTRVKRTARKILFGGLGVAGYVGGAARKRRSPAPSSDGAVDPIPEGHRTVTPYLVVRGVPRLITFLEQAFGATELMRHPRPDGTVMHAEVQIGDSRVMMGEPPDGTPPMPASIHLYVVDTDALYHLALQAGATSLREPANQFYGERTAGVQDPVGNQWWLATRIENLSPVEIALRAAMQPSGT